MIRDRNHNTAQCPIITKPIYLIYFNVELHVLFVTYFKIFAFLNLKLQHWFLIFFSAKDDFV